VSVYPNVGYEVKENPQGMKEMVLDDIVPGDQVTVSYLYPNTMTVANVNPVLISEDGISPLTFSLPRRQPSPWLVGIRSGLAFLGATFLLYWIARAAISYIIGEPIVSPFH
jgi:hypothetical protein